MPERRPGPTTQHRTNKGYLITELVIFTAGLGVIFTAGLGMIFTAGLGVISTAGLGVIFTAGLI